MSTRSSAKHQDLVEELESIFTKIIAESNGITLTSTLKLLQKSNDSIPMTRRARKSIAEFTAALYQFQIDQENIESLLAHPVAQALAQYFVHFPLQYREQHTHLSGSLDETFILPRLHEVLEGPHGEHVMEQLADVYGDAAGSLETETDVSKMVRLRDQDSFIEYLNILFVTKLILTSEEAHTAAAYSMAKRMYEDYNVGSVRLKFTFSRTNTTSSSEMIPGTEALSSEEVVRGLYQGFAAFKEEVPSFDFVLSPSFRKELDYYDSSTYPSKEADISAQVEEILRINTAYPEIAEHMTEIDTVGNESKFYSKHEFAQMVHPFRKLQFEGFQIRSHHGEMWQTLRKGIQSVDNAMNMWQVDAVEHAVALGINPNYYFHQLFDTALTQNAAGQAIDRSSMLGHELHDMQWNGKHAVLQSLIDGKPLNAQEILHFTKIKFHTAREVERYQHDVINRIIDTGVEIVSLPSSNFKLTSQFGDYKEHPFSWWEKKGIQLSIGTDNYITLDTNFIREMLILLFTDAPNLKITKLLMVATGEKRRPYMSSMLWQRHKELNM